MSRVVLFALICVAFTGLTAVSLASVDGDPDLWLRGDANNDESVNTSDLVYISNYLYGGGPQAPCPAKADVDDSGYVDDYDVIYLSNYLFSGGAAPPGQNGDTCP